MGNSNSRPVSTSDDLETYPTSSLKPGRRSIARRTIYLRGSANNIGTNEPRQPVPYVKQLVKC